MQHVVYGTCCNGYASNLGWPGSKIIEMSTNVMEILKEAQNLQLEERQLLADLLLSEVETSRRTEEQVRATLAIVEETSASMAGLDRETLIRLAEDDEFCGY